jgi:nicotinamidase-related amidase
MKFLNKIERSSIMSWKKKYRSFYYQGAPEPEDIILNEAGTALLVIDIQNKYMIDPDDAEESKRWAPFFERMNSIVIPNTVSLIETCRNNNIEVIFARIACLKEDGRDRSLSQKKPGWNYLLMPKDSEESQFVPEIVPKNDLLSRCLFS